VALSAEMQFYTGDELIRALSFNIADRVQRLVERVRQDTDDLPKDFYLPITFPDGEVAYATLFTLAAMEGDLKRAGVIVGNGLKSKHMPSVDAIDALIERYSAELERVLPISGMNPLNEVSTRVRATIINYMREQVMLVLPRPQIPGYEVLGKKELIVKLENF